MPRVTLTVNGRDWSGEVAEGASLLDLLRDHLRLTGAKLGCGEGQCGSCTVLADGRAVIACVTPAAAAQRVVTVEGLAGEGLAGEGRLHPVQQAFIEAQAFQCGFCTPGMIMAAAALLESNTRASEDEIREALDRHLCRCGTYPRIVQAVRAAGAAMAREARRG
jgi:aerobic-type carbon monoxide dehydrogenase small subunit (CoxS/CutS family)